MKYFQGIASNKLQHLKAIFKNIFNVNEIGTNAICEICLKLTIKTPEH